LPGTDFLASARADVSLHGLFTDHMVLQRDVPVPVWGWADEGERVTVEFRGRKITTRARKGKWMVKLHKLEAGGPDELKVSGKNTLLVRDVLVGEVWIGSGQSNMEWPVRLSFEPMAEIQSANNPQLRLFTVPKLKAQDPVKTVDAAWQECGPNTVSNFSAVAYHFGNYLQKALGVPVGIIHTSWGGSPAEVWIREEILAKDREYKRDILDAYTTQQKDSASALAQWEKERDEAKSENKPFNKPRPGPFWKPSELYNGMIAPLLPFAIKGAIWYQGESNAGRAYQYRRLFADMISNWRKDWGQGDFPFLLVQLAPFMAIKEQPSESSWAELREAQLLTTEELPNVGMAVITDLGDEKDIHPIWKKPVGYRLAQAARGIAYDEDIVYSGPIYRGMKIKGDRAILSFDSVGDGLFGGVLANKPPPESGFTYDVDMARLKAPLQGFAIAGEDRKFVWGTAVLDGDKIVVTSPVVSKPKAVRYGWADCPVVNLYCSPAAGAPPLPASPFRTDEWPMVTAPKADAKK
jgi:sialate O-acetylesterase